MYEGKKIEKLIPEKSVSPPKEKSIDTKNMSVKKYDFN